MNFDLATFFYGKCCSSKTISARRSADKGAINLRNAMLYVLSFVVVVFSSHFLKENFFEGVPVWKVWEVLVQKLYLGVKNMCKKFCEHPTDLCRGNILTTPPNRAMDSPMVEWCYRIYSIAIWPYLHYMTC